MPTGHAKRCFVISPIGAVGSDVRTHADVVFSALIEPALKSCEIEAVRADHMHDAGKITPQVLSAILKYDLCIALLTGQNPNVFYELAFAQVARRPLVMLTRADERLPFDVQEFRVVKYAMGDHGAIEASVKDLITKIRAVITPEYVPDGLLDLTVSEPRPRLIFYAPTLKGNPFFHEILDRIIELTTHGHQRFQVVVRKAVSGISPPLTTDHMQLLSEYDGNEVERTVIVMVPASPDSYREILQLTPPPRLNLITLDMEVEDEAEVRRCKFLKQVIVLDNEEACRIAAQHLFDYCRKGNVNAINLICCDGEFHNRGTVFTKALARLSKGKLDATVLGDGKRLRFDEPPSACDYVRRILTASSAQIRSQPTFVFCANDNLALGARVALSSFAKRSQQMKIVSFDHSDIIRSMLAMRDEFLLGSVDQQYHEYARRAVNCAAAILAGHSSLRKVDVVPPKWRDSL